MSIGERIRRRRQVRGWSVRQAADRAGISHASWSRIERGLQAADNRFVLGGIAAALECSVVELTGTVMPAGDPRAVAAQLGVHGIRTALVEIDPGRDDLGAGRAAAELVGELALVRRLRHDCDYARAVALLPGLLRDLQVACRGEQKAAALRGLCERMRVAG
ncbi:helix-turn-helix domain-containing protein [Paractinoplanes aksuensis]|uniref:helix-turn-helix domain-containing protein n=1 Tax=Paractinoplanes aksuensis TaxID=2939490 RepID=UPI00237C2594|nr:helix-turn-helix transcriptional regulator [Actinoplanes aksuensis]